MLETGHLAEFTRTSDPRAAAGGAEELVRRYAGRLLAVARCLCRAETEARNVLAETLEWAVRQAHRRPRGTSWERWLLRLLVETSLAAAAGDGSASAGAWATGAPERAAC